MCNEHQIALSIINGYIDNGKKFSYSQLIKKILSEGGILRVSIGVTVRMYLMHLVQEGVLDFDQSTGTYIISKEALIAS